MVPAIKDIQNLKSAHLIGKPEFGAVIESDEFFLGTYYQAADTSYPGHAHEPEEMYHTLVGTTQWGDSLDNLGWYGPDEFRFHPSCHPHPWWCLINQHLCWLFIAGQVMSMV